MWAGARQDGPCHKGGVREGAGMLAPCNKKEPGQGTSSPIHITHTPDGFCHAALGP